MAPLHCTSIGAKRGIESDGTEDTQRDKILNVLRENGPMTHRAVSKATGIYHKTVTSRMADMRTEGIIREAYEDQENGRTVTVWEIGTPPADDRKFGLYFSPEEWLTIMADAYEIGGDIRTGIAEKIEERFNRGKRL